METYKIKIFFKNHKKQIIRGALVITGSAIGLYFLKKSVNKMRLRKLGYEEVGITKGNYQLPLKGTHEFVDKDIFENLAPSIEEAVLTEGLDEDFFETTYHVAWPKGGDFKNGVYEELKKVTVHVMDITE